MREFPTLKSALARIFSIDVRSLAALRIALGACVAGDLLWRAPYLRHFYAADGVYPPPPPHWLHPYTWHGSVEWAVLLFAVTGVLAACLAAGFRTRLATAGCWWLTNSLFYRGWELTDGGDAVLVLALFWSMFLPLGERWSVDARRRAAPSRAADLSVPGAALLLLPVAMYLVTVLQKNGPEWVNGSAVWFALNHSLRSHLLGPWVGGMPALCVVLTHSARLIELVAPILLLIPGFRGVPRMMGVVLLVILQAGIALHLRLGLFPFHSTLLLLPFLGPGFWDAVSGRPGRPWFLPPAASGSPPRRWANAVAAPFLVYSFVSMGTTLAGHKTQLPFSLMGAFNSTWGMYAPSPSRFEARLDVAVKGALRPSWVAAMAGMDRNYRLRTFRERMMESETMRKDFADWVCRGIEPSLSARSVRLEIERWPTKRPANKRRWARQYQCAESG